MIGTALPREDTTSFVRVGSNSEQIDLFGDIEKIFGGLYQVTLASKFTEGGVGLVVNAVSESQCWVVSVIAGSTEELGGHDFSSNTQAEEDDQEEKNKNLEDTNEAGVIFLESINTHNGAKDNDQVSSNQYSENGLSLFGIVEEDLTVSKSIDGDPGHAETYNENDECSESGNALKAA